MQVPLDTPVQVRAEKFRGALDDERTAAYRVLQDCNNITCLARKPCKSTISAVDNDFVTVINTDLTNRMQQIGVVKSLTPASPCEQGRPDPALDRLFPARGKWYLHQSPWSCSINASRKYFVAQLG